MQLSRRSFLGGSLSLIAAPVVAKIPMASAIALPEIKGDGIHDDTDGLQALFDGKPFYCEREGIVDHEPGGSWQIVRGVYRLTKTVVINSRGGYAQDLNIIFNPSDDSAAALRFTKNAQNIRIERLDIQPLKPNVGGVIIDEGTALYYTP